MKDDDLEKLAPTGLDKTGNIDRRRKTYKDLLDITPRIDELLTEEIDGEVYEYRRSPQCRVCNADKDVKNLIDSCLLHPMTYRDTLRMATPLMDAKGIPPDERPSYMGIRNHQKRHLPFDKLALREMVERRAAAKGKQIVDGSDRLLTTEALFEAVVQKGWADLAAGRLRPSLAETMAAAMRLETMEKDAEGGVEVQSLMAQLHIITSVIQEVVPEEMWATIVERVEQARAEFYGQPPQELESPPAA